MRVLEHATTTANGSLAVNSFVQHDTIITKNVAETVLHNPMVLDAENGKSVFLATTSPGCSGGGGDGLLRVLDALKSSTLDKLVIFDVADMGPCNTLGHRYWEAMVDEHDLERLQAGLAESFCLLRLCRCEGHQLHLVASVSTKRSGVASPIFSTGVLLRQGSFKVKVHGALEHIVRTELDHTQGGVVDPEDTAYAREVLDRTLLGGFDENMDRNASKAARNLCDRAVATLNRNWKFPRVSHTCMLVPDGAGGWKFCCANRLYYK